MLRIIKIVLVISVGAWALVGAFGNVIGWEATIGAVGATTSMATFEGGADDWRATENPALILAGAVFILALKIIAGVLCLAGAWRMVNTRSGDAAAFHKAKALALTGCAVAMFMLFMGWIVIAETWFEAWRSDLLREQALQSAFRYCGMIGVIALFVGMRDEEA
jgi:predicted small integral membrane protein